MGVEGRNLYTADVTRTLPVDGTFTPLQRDLYSLVLAAQQAGIDAVRPGAGFQAPHDAAMEVLAHGLEDLGLLPVPGRGGALPRQQGLRPLDAALDQPHARHGRPRLRPARPARPTTRRPARRAWCSPSSPGLYFQEDDLLVPEELRGIGIRIEDDIVVTADGPTNLSASLPRDAAAIEEWMGALRA